MREILYGIRYVLLLVAVVSIGLGFALGRSASVVAPTGSSSPDYFVKLEKDGAKPDRLSIRVGEMVQFNARDGSYHDIVEASDGDISHATHDGSGYRSGVFAPDEGYQATFLKSGSYIFHDHLHPNIVIYIDVQ